mgnify:CR=1 FL=1
MTELITYLGDENLKRDFLMELGKHEAADAIMKGTYGRLNGVFRGCAIGCALNSLNTLHGKPPLHQTDNHARMPIELGWPLWLAYADDTIFENLPDDLSKTWPRRLAEAVPVGVAVPDTVLASLLRWMLIGDRHGVVHATNDHEVKDIVRTMGALFDRAIAGEVVPDVEWDEAARDARAAWAAWAARAAWAAWAARAAWDGFYPALSVELLRLLAALGPAILPVDGNEG